jgi:hypothetical protein
MILYVLKMNEDSFRSAIWTYGGFDRTMFTLEIFYGFDAGGFHWIYGFDVQMFSLVFHLVYLFEALKKIVCVCLDLLTCQWTSLPFCT